MPWEVFQTLIPDSLPDYTRTIDSQTLYGSKPGRKFSTNGFFSTLKVDGRWWVIDPEGYPGIQRGVSAVSPGSSERNKFSFQKQFETKQRWATETFTKLTSLGFYSTGSWSDVEAVKQFNQSSKVPFSYTIILNWMSKYGKQRGGTYQLPGNIGYPNQCIFVFDPGFKEFCEKEAQKLTATSNDRNLVGYFSDNELPFSLNNLEGYLNLTNPEDPGRLFAEQWIKTQNISREKITNEHRLAFVGIVAERYYRIVSEALRKNDSNHMYLGSRLHGSAKNLETVLKAAGTYCDIVSINYYGDWTPRENWMTNWGEWAGKPFMITEFYTKGMDVGLANTTGAGYTVRTQLDRAYAYQHFCLHLLNSPHCVGWHWFKYQDNDPEAKDVDPSNIDSNKGIVNNTYEWHQPLVDKMGEFNNQVYSLINYLNKR